MLQMIVTDTVSVINTATNTVSATIAVGNDPYGISVSPMEVRYMLRIQW